MKTYICKHCQKQIRADDAWWVIADVYCEDCFARAFELLRKEKDLDKEQIGNSFDQLKKAVLIQSNICFCNGHYRYVDFKERLMTTGFKTKAKLIQWTPSIRFDRLTVNLMQKRYEKIFNEPDWNQRAVGKTECEQNGREYKNNIKK
jgi:hypothetical protein